MSEILDEELIVNEKKDFKKLRNKAIFQVVIMLVFSFILIRFGLPLGALAAFYQLAFVAFLIVISFYFFALFCNALIYLVRRKKIYPYAFLIEVIRGGFYFWLIIVGIMLLDRIFLNYGY